MTLRKLGRAVANQDSIDELAADRQRDTNKLLEVLNRFMALMTNEDEPPTRKEDIDLP
jgi:hypothetical protein